MSLTASWASLAEDISCIRLGSDIPASRMPAVLETPRRRRTHLPRGVLPAEFGQPVVVDAEMVGDLVHDRSADLVGDLLLGAADRTDRLAVDGDPVGQHPRVIRRPAGERDALVEAEQARRARVVLDG